MHACLKSQSHDLYFMPEDMRQLLLFVSYGSRVAALS